MTNFREYLLINRLIRFVKRAIQTGFMLVAGAVITLAILWHVFPFSKEFLNIRSSAKIVLSDKGEPMRVFLGEDDSLCIPIRLDEMSPWVIKATIAVEDRRFYSHHGIDGIALARAILQNSTSMRRMSGASTISMQLMRMSFGRKRTISSKLLESFRALQLESSYSKDDILEMYLNSAPYGGNIYGVEAASLTYFGKRCKDLTLGEAALLAGIPQSPANYRPDEHPLRAYRRREIVLNRMVETGFIENDIAEKALTQKYSEFRYPMPIRSPHFCDFANARIKTNRIESFINLNLQTITERSIRSKINEFYNRGISDGAGVIIDVRRSAIVAMTGSPDYFRFKDGQVNGAIAKRSPGSALKPFLYGLGYDAGIITPDTVVADVPKRFTEYIPLNFDKEYMGLMPAGEALACSRNVPAVELLRKIGTDDFLKTLVKSGFNSLQKSRRYKGLTLALGGGEVSLLELANAYAMLARLGVYKDYRISLSQKSFREETVIDKGAAWMVYESLRRAARLTDPEIAWKTGTSWGFRDAWCIGYDADYVVAIWFGNFDGRPSQALSGSDIAKPVVFEIFRQIAAGKGGYSLISKPDDVSQRRVCSKTGLPASEACPDTRYAYYMPLKTEHGSCSIHTRRLITDENGISRFEVTEKWEPAIDAWLRRTRRADKSDSIKTVNYLRIISPVSGDEFAITDDSRSNTQKISLLANSSGNSKLYWYINGIYAGESINQQPVLWEIKKGTHIISVADKNGLTDKCTINVKDLRDASP